MKYLVVKPRKVKVGRKVPIHKVTRDLYQAVQEKCVCLDDKEYELRDKFGYADIIPVVCIRTTYSNEVIVSDNGTVIKEYVARFPYADKLLQDLSILTCKQAMLEVFKDQDVPQEVLMNSGAYPIGITFHNNKYYLLSHVVLDEKFVNKDMLAEGYSFMHIAKFVPKGELETSLFEKLLIIKQEESNE